MKIPESLLVALFCIMIVFFVLVCLSVLIKLFSSVFGAMAKRKETAPEPVKSPSAPAVKEASSSGTLELQNVDEPTAALIMAVVGEESGIPLSELSFKSIKLVRK